MRKKALSLFESISIAHLLSFSLGIAERCLRVSRAVRAPTAIAEQHMRAFLPLGWLRVSSRKEAEGPLLADFVAEVSCAELRSMIHGT
ncbi:MAG: hypothetical protein WAO08_30270 [Hyphomicrobiaceae bacterium]